MVKLRHGSKQDRPFIRDVKVSCTGIDIFYGMNDRLCGLLVVRLQSMFQEL